MNSLNTYIDLFAGTSALAEGFIRNDFTPVGHIEINSDACLTIKTRIAYHYLKKTNNLKPYYDYLKGEISREGLYSLIPSHLVNTVINSEITKIKTPHLFARIDYSLKTHNKRNVDIIVGGPPCQAYSLIGRHKENIEDDPRNTLYILYGKFLSYYKPKIFIFENVPGILSAGNSYFFDNLCKYYKRIGYDVEAKIYNASDYGVLQDRKRVIITGFRKDLGLKLGIPDSVKRIWTAKNIFSDLRKLKPGEGNFVDKYAKPINDYLDTFEIRDGIKEVTHHITRPHNNNDLKIYQIAIEKFNDGTRLKYSDLPKKLRTHKNITSFLDRYKVVSDKGVAHTIVAHIAKDGHYYIHPDIEQCRSISVREAARIQSFPDDFYFEGSRTAAFTQIGNAVPPLLSFAIAKEIKNII